MAGTQGRAPSLLPQIDSPADLRRLPVEALPKVCAEIREFLIENLSVNPGHFASSMGAVDIIVALHYVFDTPYDRLVWDVGHQAYAHKILTGRREKFRSQRTRGGISGFPSPLESPADTFMTGHASNSISAALGMAIADKLTPGEGQRKTVAVIGDASISGGLAFEGLNNTANNPNDLLIVLNDNNMSIDDNVGALHRYLSNLNTSSRYNRLRDRVYRLFRRKGLINDSDKGRILRFNNSLKALISRQQNIFEGLNIRYFGPFDGHDVINLVRIFREIKEMKGPRILHLHTVKGKGYAPAEKDPASWHAPGRFDPATGLRKSGGKGEKWQNIFGDHLVSLAKRRDDIIGITAGMLSGTSVSSMMRAFPERTFDVGISEGHAVTFAGGLAAAGKHPFVAIYSAFLQRAYDNIINDVAIQHLPVTFCIDRAGVVGENGVTHHGVFDLVYLRAIPGMTVAAPMDAPSLCALMDIAADLDGPMAIRYPRGNAPSKPAEPAETTRLAIGKGRRISGGEIGDTKAETAILAIGDAGNEALNAVGRLHEEGIEAHLYDMIWLKPLDTDLIDSIAGRYRHIVTVEDGAIAGGFGSAVCEYLEGSGYHVEITCLGIPDRWVGHGSVAQLRSDCGYDADAIVSAVKTCHKS